MLLVVSLMLVLLSSISYHTQGEVVGAVVMPHGKIKKGKRSFSGDCQGWGPQTMAANNVISGRLMNQEMLRVLYWH